MPFDEVSTSIDTLDNAVYDLALGLLSDQELNYLREDTLIVVIIICTQEVDPIASCVFQPFVPSIKNLSVWLRDRITNPLVI